MMRSVSSQGSEEPFSKFLFVLSFPASHLYTLPFPYFLPFCTMMLDRALHSPSCRRLLNQVVANRGNVVMRPLMTARFLSTAPHKLSDKLNKDNMNDHRVDHKHWKTPILKELEDDETRDLHGEHPRVSVLMELKDRVGILHDVLKYFWKNDINVSRIESRPVRTGQWGKKKFDFYMDFDGSLEDAAVQKLLDDLVSSFVYFLYHVWKF
jgi:hypothetical protein